MRVPKNRFYVSWMDSTTHYPFILPPAWKEKNHKTYFDIESFSPAAEVGHTFDPITINTWLNTLKWTDDHVKDIILGFRERGLENETLFVMYKLHFLT
jgi:hypothetical protein